MNLCPYTIPSMEIKTASLKASLSHKSTTTVPIQSAIKAIIPLTENSKSSNLHTTTKSLIQSAMDTIIPKTDPNIIETKWITETEFFQEIDKILLTPNFEQRFQSFCQILTQTEESSYQMWLDINDNENKYVLLSIKKGKFYSSIFDQKSVDPKHKEFFYISLLKDESNDALDKPLLHIRSSTDGEIGEIAYINRSDTVSGTEIINFYKKLQRFLRIKTVWLYDDAKIGKLQLADYLPVAHKEPIGFYERKLGFKVADFSKKPCLFNDGGSTFQSATSFKKSVTYLRKYKYSSALRRLKNRQVKNNISRIIGRMNLSPNESNLHQIIHKVFQEAIQTADNEDFKLVKKTFLPNEKERDQNVFPKSFFKHLNTMQTSRIYKGTV